MEEKRVDGLIRPGMTSSSSHLASTCGNDFLELVWQNGQILVQGGSSPTSSRTRKRSSCIGYSLNPSREAYDEDPCVTKRARLNTLYTLLDSSHQNSQETNHQNSCPFDFKYTKSNSFSNKVGDEFSNLRAASKESNTKPSTTAGNTQLCSSSSHSQKHDDLGSDQGIGKLNFSNFLRPALFLKSAYQGNSATQPRNGAVLARVEEFKAGTGAAIANSKAPDHSVVIDSANKGSHSLNGFHHHEGQTALTSYKANPAPFLAKSDQETVLLPDQHSEAIKSQGSHGQHHNLTHRAKGRSADEFYNEPMVASSLCSLGASNDPTLRSRKHEDTDDSTYISDNDEEPEDVITETPALEGSRGKRSRNAEIHNLSERKRRDKINKKMRALKELIPNCNKMDKASMLDDAIDYLKTLKLQLQVMSMGSGFCMPLMMLPGGGGGHHIPQLMGGGMSLRPAGMGIPYSLPPQFPNIPQLPPHAHTAITDNRLHMLGFPNHLLPLPFSMCHPPFIPMPSKHLPPNLTTLDDSLLPKNSDLNVQLACAMQASNQGTN